MIAVRILIAFAAGWLVAQACKLVGAMVSRCKGTHGSKRQRLSWQWLSQQLMKSGGMPSGHAASLTAATVCIGASKGIDSAVFGLAVCVLLIVLYDAVNVRYAVGEQAKALRSLGKKVREIDGHTIPQVLVGILIGVFVGMLVMMAPI